MKGRTFARVVATLLSISMLTTTALAAPMGGRGGRNNGKNENSSWSQSEWGQQNNKKDKNHKNNKWQQSQNPGYTESEDTTASSDQQMLLVEDATTVENGEILRASTYMLTSDSSAASASTASVMSLAAGANDGIMLADDTTTTDSTILKYFPVTMYDYGAATINAATDALDSDLTVREGLYFSNGAPAYTRAGSDATGTLVEYTVEDGNVIIANGTYAICCTDTVYYVTDTVNTSSYWSTTVLNGTEANDLDSASLWTFTRQEDGTYTVQDASGAYLKITGSNSATTTTEPNTVTISAQSANNHTITIYDDDGENNGYLNSLAGTHYGVGYFGGYTSGSTFALYAVTEGDNEIIADYEAWNRWDKASGNTANGDLIYTGLVQDALVDDQIVFNVNEGGIFNADTNVKDIYEYVGLPFVLGDDGYYTFDSDENGVYFADTDGDGEADPQSGTAEAPHNLHFAEGAPQPMPTDLSVGDGSTNAFFPFNSQSSYSASQVNYHFGMRADIPFSMTANGRVKATDDESAPITFTFSGDDDVWVFIDGHLVIDLGGIHNRLDVTIDFANNTITYSEENAQDTDNVTASYNDNTNFAMTQQLFTKDGVEGVIPQSREAFALDLDHEMQVFYLERGEGTSNCKIKFNLPMNDTVLVTKDATQSWSEPEDGSNDDGVDQLTAAEQAIINNIDFGFTLYKKNASETEFSPVGNTNFYLIGRGVEGTVIHQTDANGHFYLKNGQSAKFITEIPSDGVTYYVVEDKVPDGFVSPDFNFAGEATYDYSYTGTSDNNGDGTAESVNGTASAGDASSIPEQIIPMPGENEDGTLSWAENKSYEITVKGSIEANDSIEFICSNYLDAELPNPTALAYEDIIVIDYGLPVQIDPLANDVFRGDSVEIIAYGGADLTLGAKTDEDGDGVYEETEQTITSDGTYDFGTVRFNDVTYAVDDKGNVTRDTLTYTLNEQLTEVEVLTYVIKVTGQEKQEATDVTLTQYDYAIGKIYIVPATTMYYEENFSDLVTFNNGKGAWDDNATTDASAVSPYQEPGVVGTIGDSTYGTDAAYLNDSGDSNGTSRHGDTTNGAIQFTYTFTGTGTSFFARTSAKTGYMQVKLYKGVGTSGKVINLTYRDTYYNDTNNTNDDSSGTLYNVPVYTESGLDYGTYTVVVTVAKAGTKGAGAYDEASGYNLSGNEFYLDGIRVMQPLNESNETVINEETDETITDKALGAYATDGESNIDVVTLRQKMITDAEEGTNKWNFVVLTDTNGEIITAEDYVSIGPKEEVYLQPGQSVTFAIEHWHKDGYLLHMGMKAPFGTATAQVGQTTYNLANATDCYYDVTSNYSSLVTKYEQAVDGDGHLLYTDATGARVYEADGSFYYVADGVEVAENAVLTPVDDTTQPYYVAIYTIAATDKIVSLTNLKVTGNYEFALVEDDNCDVNVNGNEG